MGGFYYCVQGTLLCPSHRSCKEYNSDNLNQSQKYGRRKYKKVLDIHKVVFSFLFRIVKERIKPFKDSTLSIMILFTEMIDHTF